MILIYTRICLPDKNPLMLLSIMLSENKLIYSKILLINTNQKIYY